MIRLDYHIMQSEYTNFFQKKKTHKNIFTYKSYCRLIKNEHSYI